MYQLVTQHHHERPILRRALRQQNAVAHGRLQDKTIFALFYAQSLPGMSVLQSGNGTYLAGSNLLYHLIFLTGINPYLIDFFLQCSGNISKFQRLFHGERSSCDLHMSKPQSLRISCDFIDPCSKLLRLNRLFRKMLQPVQQFCNAIHAKGGTEIKMCIRDSVCPFFDHLLCVLQRRIQLIEPA